MTLRSLALAALALAALAGAAPGAAAQTTGGRAYVFADRPLVEARGERFRFASDLVARSALLVSFTFTGCLKLCRPSDAVMDQLAAKLKNDPAIRLVTITLDPLADTPERLLEERVGRNDPSRLFLTGDFRDVLTVLDGLGMRIGPDQDHRIEFIAIRRGGGLAIPISDEDADPDAILAAVERIR